MLLKSLITILTGPFISQRSELFLRAPDPIKPKMILMYQVSEQTWSKTNTERENGDVVTSLVTFLGNHSSTGDNSSYNLWCRCSKCEMWLPVPCGYSSSATVLVEKLRRDHSTAGLRHSAHQRGNWSETCLGPGMNLSDCPGESVAAQCQVAWELHQLSSWYPAPPLLWKNAKHSPSKKTLSPMLRPGGKHRHWVRPQSELWQGFWCQIVG